MSDTTPSRSAAIFWEYNGRKPLPDILADYRQWRSMQEDRVGTHSEDCHMWPRHERCMIVRLATALETERQVNLTLTEAERDRLRTGPGLMDTEYTETAGNCHVMTGPEREAIQYFAQWGTWTAASVHAKALEAYDERTK